ncbi:MAG: hypothetical protein CMF61_08160 [Magnetococcales bacterium]|nr:hypothetical protein [Magnetococcales bacterium]
MNEIILTPENKVYELALHNEDLKPLNVDVFLEDYEMDGEGYLKQGASAFSLSEFLNVSPVHFLLQPGDTQSVSIRLSHIKNKGDLHGHLVVSGQLKGSVYKQEIAIPVIYKTQQGFSTALQSVVYENSALNLQFKKSNSLAHESYWLEIYKDKETKPIFSYIQKIYSEVEVLNKNLPLHKLDQGKYIVKLFSENKKLIQSMVFEVP